MTLWTDPDQESAKWSRTIGRSVYDEIGRGVGCVSEFEHGSVECDYCSWGCDLSRGELFRAGADRDS